MARANTNLVTIFGGAGFVGTQLVQVMARKGYRIRVAVRRPDLAGHLMPLGSVGQIVPIQANIRNMPSVERAVEGADIVINLVGIKSQSGRQRFGAVHALGAKNVATAAKNAGATTMVHMSALGANPKAQSASARSKALGEEEVLKAFPEATIIRPSIIFGQGDGFFNLFGALASLMPVMPLIEGNTRFQPVYVGDVADALAIAAEGGVKSGRIYELGGSEIETMRELMQRLLKETARERLLLPVPTMLAKLQAYFLQLLPSPLLTVDQVIQLGQDNVVSDEARKQKRTIAAFGITPTAMDAILPTYLWRFKKHGQFDKVEA